MILSDFDLRAYVSSGRLRVEPFSEEIVRENGLDLRLGRGVCELVPGGDPLDPYEQDPSERYRCYEAEKLLISPGSRYLLHTVEHVGLPEELVGFVELRSTLARLGLVIPPTMVDGGFEGQLTIELLPSVFPIVLRPGTRFLHLILAKASTPVTRPYRGKYQGQKGVTLPKRLEPPRPRP